MGRGSVWLRKLGALHAVAIVWTSGLHVHAQDLDAFDRESDVSAPSSPSSRDDETDSYPAAPSPAATASQAVAEPAPQPAAAAPGPVAPQPSAAAQVAITSPYELAPSQRWGSTRVLGQHSFLLGTFVPSGLVNSHLGVRAGMEYHQVPGYVQLPSLLDSKPQEVELRTLNIAETIDFGVRLHDHFAIFGDAYGKARVGANINTLLGTGADYTYGGRLGLLVKLFHLSSFQISVSGQAGYYAGQSAGILALFQDLNIIAREAVQQVQQNPVIDLDKAVEKLNTAFRTATADLLTPFEGFTYGVSLNVAQAVGRYFGLQASVGYYAESATYRPTRYDTASGGPVMQEHTVSTTRPSFGIAADFDAAPAGFPFALLLEYRATPTSVTDTQDVKTLDMSSLEHLLALGLFYSGRTDLQLGVTTYSVYGQLPTLNANARGEGKPLDLALQLVFRYYW